MGFLVVFNGEHCIVVVLDDTRLSLRKTLCSGEERGPVCACWRRLYWWKGSAGLSIKYPATWQSEGKKNPLACPVTRTVCFLCSLGGGDEYRVVFKYFETWSELNHPVTKTREPMVDLKWTKSSVVLVLETMDNSNYLEAHIDNKLDCAWNI